MQLNWVCWLLEAQTSEIHGHDVATISNGGIVTDFGNNQDEFVLEYLFLQLSLFGR